jgi:hypothetical protein
MANEEELSEKEKLEIVQNLFRIYVKMIREFSQELHVDKREFEQIFKEEMKD